MNPILVTLLAVVFVVLSALLIHTIKLLRDERRRAQRAENERELFRARRLSSLEKAQEEAMKNQRLRRENEGMRNALRWAKESRRIRPASLP